VGPEPGNVVRVGMIRRAVSLGWERVLLLGLCHTIHRRERQSENVQHRLVDRASVPAGTARIPIVGQAAPAGVRLAASSARRPRTAATA